MPGLWAQRASHKYARFVDTLEFWIENWWLPLAVVLAGVCITSAGTKSVRERVWKPLGRRLRWLTTIRLTTSGRLRAMQEDANQMIRSQQEQTVAIRDRAVTAADTASVRIAALQDQLGAAMENTANLVERARAEGRTEGHADGRAELEAEIAAQRSIPIPSPSWRIRLADDGADSFTIENLEPRARVSDVRLEASPRVFAFDSSVMWDGPFEGAQSFSGQRTGVTGRMPVTFTVHFRDANRDWREREAVLPPAKRLPPPSGKVLRSDPNEPLGGLRF